MVCFFILSFLSIPSSAQNINLSWNTFLGSSDYDYGFGIALESSGNIYVTGESWAAWGSPVRAYSGGADAFLASVDISGNLVWNTFLGSGTSDSGFGIALDSSGNIYVTGESFATWVSRPISNPYVIYNVREDHNVVVTFEPDVYPPSINISAIRKTEMAWIIRKDYGEISITITEHATNPLPVSRYILYRMDSGTWNQISEYSVAGTYLYIDKFLEKGKQASYKVAALDADGVVVAESNIVHI